MCVALVYIRFFGVWWIVFEGRKKVLMLDLVCRYMSEGSLVCRFLLERIIVFSCRFISEYFVCRFMYLVCQIIIYLVCWFVLDLVCQSISEGCVECWYVSDSFVWWFLLEGRKYFLMLDLVCRSISEWSLVCCFVSEITDFSNWKDMFQSQVSHTFVILFQKKLYS